MGSSLCLLVRSLSECFAESYYVPGNVVGSGDMEAFKFPAFLELMV